MSATTVAASSAEERGRNPLRPANLDEVIGQLPAKHLLTAAIDSCYARRHVLPHTLLVGQSGTGKTTFSNAVANTLGVPVFQVEAPISYETLLELRTTMPNGAILFIDEIHQQAVQERRGKSAGCQPEVLFSIMEDGVLLTQEGVLPFPNVTIMGATTDEGMLPDAFINRFPLRPVLVKYEQAEMEQIVRWNAEVLDLAITPEAVRILAAATRGVPREANNLVKNAVLLTPPGQVCNDVSARMVLDLVGLTADGLTRDMQGMLTFLYTRARRESPTQGVRYQASVSSIATAIGKSRDQKAIALRVEPFLIELGFVQVAHGGRVLTDAGIVRAQELLK